MPRFFVDTIGDDFIELQGENARHISRSLRMKIGEEITLSNGRGTDYYCEITAVSQENVAVKVLYSRPSESEPDLTVNLYQGVPKGDKLEDVIQKCVELGITKITPVVTERSVSRPDEKSAQKKKARYEKISLEAAKQCGRGIVPEIGAFCPFNQAVSKLDEDVIIVFYEGGGLPLKDIIEQNRSAKSVAVFIGPEGGFEKSEVDALLEKGAFAATLGKRILRTQTAPVAALSCIMMLTGNME